jgi:hypothetical protein
VTAPREKALQEENLGRARATSNRRMEKVILQNLARFARMEGRFDDAIAMHVEAYRILRGLDEPVEIAELGVHRSWATQRDEETRSLLESALDASALAELSEHGRKLSADEAVALARDALQEA